MARGLGNNDSLILGQSIGIEIEAEDVLENDIPREIRNTFNVTTDASVSNDAMVSKEGLYFKKGTPYFKAVNSVCKGIELVSNPLNTETDDYMEHIRKVTELLDCLGESKQSFRAGIHIHVNMSNNLRIVKSILRLGRYLESVFFYVGGMGYEYRGTKYDSIYCRPITSFGPIAVPTPRGMAQCFDIDDLLEVKTMDDFWIKFGDVQLGNLDKYVPIRYHWLNLYALVRTGTLEFRIFNKTMNPNYIHSAINLCKAFCDLSLRSDYNSLRGLDLLENNSIYNNQSKSQILGTFNTFANITGMDADDIDNISTIISNTPAIRLKDRYVKSHLPRVKTHWENNTNLPKILNKMDIDNPIFEDIHVLRGERQIG